MKTQGQESPTHQLLTKLEVSGDLGVLVRAGYCSPMIVNDLNIFRFVGARKATGDNTVKAVGEAAKAFKCCERSVYSILKKFR